MGMQAPGTLLTNCATLSEFVSSSMSSFPRLKDGEIVIPSQMDTGGSPMGLCLCSPGHGADAEPNIHPRNAGCCIRLFWGDKRDT